MLIIGHTVVLAVCLSTPFLTGVAAQVGCATASPRSTKLIDVCRVPEGRDATARVADLRNQFADSLENRVRGGGQSRMSSRFPAETRSPVLATAVPAGDLSGRIPVVLQRDHTAMSLAYSRAEIEWTLAGWDGTPAGARNRPVSTNSEPPIRLLATAESRLRFRLGRALRDVIGGSLRFGTEAHAANQYQLPQAGLTVEPITEGVRVRGADHSLDLLQTGLYDRVGAEAITFAINMAKVATESVRDGNVSLQTEGRAMAALRLGAVPSRDAASVAARCPLSYRVVEVGDRKVATCQGGADGPLVLFEAGLGDGMETWAAMLHSVSRVTRVLGYDRSGIGASTPSAGPRTAVRIATELEELLAVLGEQGPVVLVGHSLGGLYARVLAARGRVQVRGVLLLDPTPGALADSQRVILGDSTFRALRARNHVRIAGMPGAVAEWQSLDTSMGEARLARWPRVSASSVLSSGQSAVQSVRLSAAWLAMHRLEALELGGTQAVIRNAGHYVHHDAQQAVLVELSRIIRAARESAGG
ncbi:MAG: alpha/beta hydrolase [Gemmatimonadales bacterium]|nr:alpha/beta hydrolase [Gemmatimonadales bacterium]